MSELALSWEEMAKLEKNDTIVILACNYCEVRRMRRAAKMRIPKDFSASRAVRLPFS